MNPNNYPTGQPVQANQTQQTAQQLQQAAVSAAANPSSLPSMDQLSQTAGSAATQLAGMQTPQARQSQINQTDIPAMQTNYDDLAKQLYDYDKMNLAPKFQFTNPGTPSDAPSYGRVEASNLTQLTPESASLSADKGLYNTNSSFALKGQNAQANGILDILGTLNSSIGNQFDLASSKYGSTVDAQRDVLKTVMQLMGMKQDAIDKELDRQDRAKERGAAAADRAQAQSEKADAEFYSAIADGQAQLQKGSSWGEVWNSIKARFPHRSAEEIDTQLGPSWKEPGAFQDYAEKLQTGKGNGSKRAEYLGALGNIEDQLGKFDPNQMGAGTQKAISALQKSKVPVVGHMLLSKDEADLMQLQGLYDSLYTTAVATLSARGATQPDLKALDALRPSISMSPYQIQGKIDSINALVGKAQAGGGNPQVNSATVAAKLKATGKYNDAQISAYLKTKGLQ